MKVAGLNNLGFQATAAKTAAGKSAPSTEKSAFEKILGANDAKPEPKPSEDRAESDALPSAPSMPSFNSPALTDRLPNNHINSTVSPAMNVPQPATDIPDDTASSLTRRVVWNDFLRKMNDLGVSAEDVLGAFGSLSEQDLSLPPEQTVDKVVMALGLDAQQAAIAKQYFNELISKTRAKSFAQELAGPDKELSLTLMTNKELQKRNLRKSLDVMDRNFFMPKPMTRGPQVPQTVAAQTQPMSAQALAGQPVEAQALAQLNPESEQALNRMSELLRATPAAPQEMNQIVAQMQQQASTPEEKKSIDTLIKNFTLQNKNNEMAAQAAMAPLAPQVTEAPAAPAASAPALGALNEIFKGAKREMMSGDDSTDEGSEDLSQLGTAATPDQRMVDGMGLKTDFQAQMSKAAGTQPSVQVPDLVQQAQVMVRDGGGEMKVTLTPEGLGDVAMHVKVVEGKVSVQMVTESDEAKKLIERQIGDLKHGLAQNNLQVDSIKIDTSSNLGKQLEQQYQDAQRHQLQAAMEQFRQDTQGWRRSFFDNGVVNPYRSQGERPRDVKAPPSSGDSRSRGNRRLDLVA